MCCCTILLSSPHPEVDAVFAHICPGSFFCLFSLPVKLVCAGASGVPVKLWLTGPLCRHGRERAAQPWVGGVVWQQLDQTQVQVHVQAGRQVENRGESRGEKAWGAARSPSARQQQQQGQAWGLFAKLTFRHESWTFWGSIKWKGQASIADGDQRLKKALVTVREVACQCWPLAAPAPTRAASSFFLKLLADVGHATVGPSSAEKHRYEESH